ncbi:hypothetical protein FACS1894104_3100 [Actinomycetota bacterium]|nr:hypothetical protein FACS1894104_3100 [Actinomycetota bacterium]
MALLSKKQNQRTIVMGNAGQANAATAAHALDIKPKENLIVSKFKALSNREKILIFGLIVVAIMLAIILLLVIPAQDRLTAAQSEYQAANASKVSTDLEIANRPIYQSNLQKAEARYNEYLAKYQAPMQPEDIDRMLTTLIEDTGFEAMSLQLAPITQESVGAFVVVSPAWVLPTAGDTDTNTNAAGATANSGSAADNSAADSTDSSSTGATPTNTNAGSGSNANAGSSSQNTGQNSSSTGPSVQLYAVQVTANGYDQNFFALLDRVVPLTWLKLMSTSYTPPSSLVVYSGNTGDDSQLYVFTFNIYVNPDATVKQP